jgi:hypothetical protein
MTFIFIAKKNPLDYSERNKIVENGKEHADEKGMVLMQRSM